MGRLKRAGLASLALLAATSLCGFERPPDPLEGVKAQIRLKNFPAATTELQKLAAAGKRLLGAPWRVAFAP